MKFLSWNVDGMRSIVKKGFYDFFDEEDADFFSIQETRVDPSELSELNFKIPDNYYQFWDSADRPGYAGTVVFTKYKPISVAYGLDGNDIDPQGRTITLEYPNFYYVNAYALVAGEELQKLPEKETWDDKFIKHVTNLKANKPVIIGADLNIAHERIDVFNPDEHDKEAGFTKPEREQYTELLNQGFCDIFRYLHPDEVKYTYWSFRYHSREDNHGWRLDQFIISDNLIDKVVSADLLNDIYGSSHCPTELIMKDIDPD